jgi:hypothetical protein
MTKSYSSFMFWLTMTILASVMLYHTSDQVQELEQKLHNLNGQIESEQQSLHVLKAEWVYLANPARVEAESLRHLGLQPTAPRRVAALQDMSGLLPLHSGTEVVPAIETAEVQAPAPVTVASAASTPAPIATKAPIEARVVQAIHNKRDRVIAALNTGHINDHMIMQHATSSAGVGASTDRIGALIGTLGLNP